MNNSEKQKSLYFQRKFHNIDLFVLLHENILPVCISEANKIYSALRRFWFQMWELAAENTP